VVKKPRRDRSTSAPGLPRPSSHLAHARAHTHGRRAKPTLAPTTGPSAAPSRSPTSSYCANQCSAVRTRKNWNKINATERALYIEAVQTLYKSGAYEKFVLIHQNGEAQSHV
jgi:hypothetical protein